MSNGSTTKKTIKPKRIPPWLRRDISQSGKNSSVVNTLRQGNLHTVCEEAKCPNRMECFSRGTATFLIMGDLCTRRCRYCSVKDGLPLALDPHEPEKITGFAKDMNLSYLVLTSVTRDDLPDGGAEHFAKCIRAVKEGIPNIKVEVLTPDFQGDKEALKTVIDAEPDVFNHNIETVERIFKKVRHGTDFQGSLDVLKFVSEYNPKIPVKTGMMVGLGEKEEEVLELMDQVLAHGVTIFTIGQYLRPSKEQMRVQEFITPEQFERYKVLGEDKGFHRVVSGPYVRSSYLAEESFYYK